MRELCSDGVLERCSVHQRRILGQFWWLHVQVCVRARMQMCGPGSFRRTMGARAMALPSLKHRWHVNLSLPRYVALTPSSETSTTRPSRVATVTIPADLNVTTCDTDSWADQADTAAVALGIVVSQYTFKFYLLPQQVGCPPTCFQVALMRASDNFFCTRVLESWPGDSSTCPPL